MNYSDLVKWPEAQERIRQTMLAQPRGYQTDLAERLGKSRAFVNQVVTGARPIPVDLLDEILSSLNLSYDVVLSELTVKPKAPDGES